MSWFMENWDVDQVAFASPFGGRAKEIAAFYREGLSVFGQS